MTTSIKQAEELIDNNQTDRKEDGAQQIQKLRFNISDLKIRFNAVCSPYIVSFVKIDKQNSLLRMPRCILNKRFIST